LASDVQHAESLEKKRIIQGLDIAIALLYHPRQKLEVGSIFRATAYDSLDCSTIRFSIHWTLARKRFAGFSVRNAPDHGVQRVLNTSLR
jgi:hypothetical protein